MIYENCKLKVLRVNLGLGFFLFVCLNMYLKPYLKINGLSFIYFFIHLTEKYVGRSPSDLLEEGIRRIK